MGNFLERWASYGAIEALVLGHCRYEMISVVTHLLAYVVAFDSLLAFEILALSLEAKSAPPTATSILTSVIVSNALRANCVAEYRDFLILYRAVFVRDLIVYRLI